MAKKDKSARKHCAVVADATETMPEEVLVKEDALPTCNHDDDDSAVRIFAPSRKSAAALAAKEKATAAPEAGHAANRDQGGNATFRSLGVSEWLVDACRELGIIHPTPVQEACIPHVLAGENVVGCAQTGSGKTAAFALPILQKLAEDPYGVFALVLTPTRELAFQMQDQFRVLGAAMGVKETLIVGGMDMLSQGAALMERPHVVLATPGRLKWLLTSDPDFARVFRRLRFLVLDEADRLLDPGFEDEMKTILDAVSHPSKRQTLLFSATMTRSLERLMGGALGPNAVAGERGGKAQGGSQAPTPPGFFQWEAYQGFETVESLRQEYLLVPAKVKEVYLAHLLFSYLGALGTPTALDDDDAGAGLAGINPSKSRKKRQRLSAPNPKATYGKGKATKQPAPSQSKLVAGSTSYTGPPIRSVMVFVSKCRTAEFLHRVLIELGLSVDSLHSRRPQRQRLAALARFRSGIVSILVATDVASRGLDIPTVDVVMNYDVPAFGRDYIHRVGRTARAGRGGLAITFVTQHDVELVHHIEDTVGRKLVEHAGPGAVERDVLAQMTAVFTARRVAVMALADAGLDGDDRDKEKKEKKEKRGEGGKNLSGKKRRRDGEERG
eukprot:jgi/Mesvir1/29085/Mv18390-RA.1